MIRSYGDITTVKGNAVIIHGVNCQNTMGSGVAKAIYTKWPEVKVQYHDYCVEEEYKGNDHLLGSVTCIKSYDPVLIWNLFSQERYGYDGKSYADASAISKGLCAIFDYTKECCPKYKDIYMPEIGCGLGGLDFREDVLPIIIALDNIYDFNIYICRIGGRQDAYKIEERPKTLYC